MKDECITSLGLPAPCCNDNLGHTAAFVTGRACLSTTRMVDSSGRVYLRCEIDPGHAKCGVQQPFVEVADEINSVRSAVGTDYYGLTVFGCARGYFGSLGSSCIRCPRMGAECRGYDDATHGLTIQQRLTRPIATWGYFDYNRSYWLPASASETDKTMAPTCPRSVMVWGDGEFKRDPFGYQSVLRDPQPRDAQYQHRATSRDVCIFACQPQEACLGGNVCAEGYVTKPPYSRCASCDTGFYSRAGFCVRCPSAAWGVLIGYVAAIVVTIALAWIFAKYEVHVALVSLGIDFMQTIAMLAFSKVAWPSAVRELFYVFSASYLDIEIVAPECLEGLAGAGADVSFKNKFFTILWLPVGIAAALLAVHTVVVLVNIVMRGKQSAQKLKQMPALISCFILIASLFYMYETETLLQVFNCAPLNDPVFDAVYPGLETDPQLYNSTLTGPEREAYRQSQIARLNLDYAWQREHGILYLQAAPEPCLKSFAHFDFSDKSTQAELLVYACIWMAVGVAGYPVAVLWWLWSNRMLVMEDQLLRAKGQGGDRISGPNTYVFRKTWSRLYYQFKPELWYWQVVIYFRKFCFLYVMLYGWNKNGGYQMVGAATVTLCFYVLHVRLAPFMGPDSYEEVLRDHQNKSVTSSLHARLRAAVQDVETRGRLGARKPVLDFQGRVNRGALLGYALAALFDYNTVEAVLLFVTIIVCLLGVCVEIHSAYYDGEATSAANGIMTIVSFAFIYFAVVAFYDTMLAAAAKHKLKLEAKRRRNSKSARNLQGLKGAAAEEAAAAEGAGSGLRGVDFFGAASRFVDATLSTGGKSASAAVRKVATEADTLSSPVEVSVNPLMKMAAGAMPPPPPPPPEGASAAQKQLFRQMTPGDLAALREAADAFPTAAPPAELWTSFRSALGDALDAATQKDSEIAALRQRVAEAEDGRAAAQAAQAALAMQAQGGGGGGGYSMGMGGFASSAAAAFGAGAVPAFSPPQQSQSAAASASALSFARQPSFRGAGGAVVTPTATQRSLKPQKPTSAGGGGRTDFAPVAASPMAAMPPPPPPPPAW